jgi:mono/diheme cytochrome c family protein
LALTGAALLVAGCAGRAVDAGSADTNMGKQLFAQNCGGRHTLADAATAGTIGPNLDDAFRAARTEKGGSFDESTVFDVTLDQMRLAAPPMPRFDSGPQALSQDQLHDIAAYVASVAGLPAGAAGGGTGTTAPTGAAGTTTAP